MPVAESWTDVSSCIISTVVCYDKTATAKPDF